MPLLLPLAAVIHKFSCHSERHPGNAKQSLTMEGVVRLPLSFSMISTLPFCHTPTQLHSRGAACTCVALIEMQ